MNMKNMVHQSFIESVSKYSPLQLPDITQFIFIYKFIQYLKMNSFFQI